MHLGINDMGQFIWQLKKFLGVCQIRGHFHLIKLQIHWNVVLKTGVESDNGQEESWESQEGSDKEVNRSITPCSLI